MEGLVLDSFKGELGKVADEFALNPTLTIANIDQKLAKIASYLDAYFDEFDFLKNYTDLPFKAFTEFSFEDICKLRFSASTMMHSTVEKTFEENVNYELFRKIKSSWWRWGVGKGTWNELVDVYNGIRNFSLDLPEEFEIRLDYTTGYNPQGGSKFSYTYLDGVFGFLVHYRGKHVMTIGFSVMQSGCLLIQQVQLRYPTRNRFLYQLPKHHIELIIDSFARSFPNHELYIVDGMSLAERILADYLSGISNLSKRLEEQRACQSIAPDQSYIDRLSERIESLTVSFNHLKCDAPRLAKLYANTGSFVRDCKLVVNEIVFYELRRQSQATYVTQLG